MERNTLARIRMLLDLYFEGATTLEQENQLRDYFAGDRQIPDDLQYAKAMFGFFRDASLEVSVSEMNPPGTTDARGKRVPLAPGCPEAKATAPRRRRGIWMTAASFAAAAALLLTFSLNGYRGTETAPDDKVVYCYINGVPVTDLETAMMYTRLSLDAVGETMRIPAGYLAVMEEPVSVLNRTMESLSRIGDLIKEKDGIADGQ